MTKDEKNIEQAVLRYYRSHKFQEDEPKECPECHCRDIRVWNNSYICFKCSNEFPTTIKTIVDRVLNMPELLSPINGGLGLYMPVGPLTEGGTCEFLTSRCIVACYVKRQPGFSSIQKKAKRTYRTVSEESEKIVALRLLAEAESKGKDLIHFFMSGDCPSRLTEKMCNILSLISGWGVHICGFTRNYDLFVEVMKSPNVLKCGHLVYTLETQSKIKDLPDGWYGVPNYDTGIVHLYYQSHQHRVYSGGCDAYGTLIPYSLKKAEVPKGCTECRKMSKGCFSIGEELVPEKLTEDMPFTTEM